MHALPTPLLELLSVFKEESRSLVDDLEVSFMADPILVKGRYVKLTRDVSQTPWNLNEDDDDDTKPDLPKVVQPGKAHTNIVSVQELVGDEIKKEIFAADEIFLHGSGREDIDVRMLGHGRPFILEFINPKNSISCHSKLDQMRLMANKSAKVKALGMEIATK